MKMAKFDGHNFVMFQKRVKAVLSQKGLTKYLRVLPTTEEEREEDERAEGLLVMMLSDSVLGGIKEFNNTMELWEKLKKRHLASSRAVKSRLHYALTTIRYTGGDAVKFTSDFTKITNELAAIGKPVDEEWQESFFITAITERCKEFVTAYEAVEEKTPDGDSEYVGRVEILMDKFIAYVDKGAKPGRPQGNETEELALASPYFPYKCHKCGEKGHKKVDCPKNKNKNKNKKAQVTDQVLGSWALVTGLGSNDTRLILDPASTYHICNDKGKFGKDYKRFETQKEVGGIAAGINIKCLGAGTTNWQVRNSQNQVVKIALQNTMYAPKASENLLSGGLLEKNGAKITFEKGIATIEKGELVIQGRREGNNLFYFGSKYNRKQEPKERANALNGKADAVDGKADTAKVYATSVASKLQHSRYCHPGEWVSTQLGIKHVNKAECRACGHAKSKQKEFPIGTITEGYDVAEKVCADLCGPISSASVGGARYLQPCLEKRTHWLSISALKTKDQAGNELQGTIAYIERQTGKEVKVVQTDHGGEYTSRDMEKYFKEKGIRHQKSIRYTPKQNASVEAVNRVLMTRVMAMLGQSGVPQKYDGRCGCMCSVCLELYSKHSHWGKDAE